MARKKYLASESNKVEKKITTDVIHNRALSRGLIPGK